MGATIKNLKQAILKEFLGREKIAVNTFKKIHIKADFILKGLFPVLTGH